MIVLAVVLSASAFANTFTVINTNDSGAGSLRQAITDANNHAGLDTIDFNIPGSGVQTITPASDLPAITDPVIIDGYTQTGASANTLADVRRPSVAWPQPGTVSDWRRIPARSALRPIGRRGPAGSDALFVRSDGSGVV